MLSSQKALRWKWSHDCDDARRAPPREVLQTTSGSAKKFYSLHLLGCTRNQMSCSPPSFLCALSGFPSPLLFPLPSFLSHPTPARGSRLVSIVSVHIRKTSRVDVCKFTAPCSIHHLIGSTVKLNCTSTPTNVAGNIMGKYIGKRQYRYVLHLCDPYCHVCTALGQAEMMSRYLNSIIDI